MDAPISSSHTVGQRREARHGQCQGQPCCSDWPIDVAQGIVSRPLRSSRCVQSCLPGKTAHLHGNLELCRVEVYVEPGLQEKLSELPRLAYKYPAPHLPRCSMPTFHSTSAGPLAAASLDHLPLRLHPTLEAVRRDAQIPAQLTPQGPDLQGSKYAQPVLVRHGGTAARHRLAQTDTHASVAAGLQPSKAQAGVPARPWLGPRPPLRPETRRAQNRASRSAPAPPGGRRAAAQQGRAERGAAQTVCVWPSQEENTS